jgi:hypothetical protein
VGAAAEGYGWRRGVCTRLSGVGGCGRGEDGEAVGRGVHAAMSGVDEEEKVVVAWGHVEEVHVE